MRWDIYRVELSKDLTYGVLLIDGKFFCLTLELPWKGNDKNISCIKEGIYPMKQFQSKRHGLTYSILNVPGRTNIEFHVGNTVSDSNGCILVGRNLVLLDHKRGISGSSTTMKELQEQIALTECAVLVIKNIKEE